LAIQLPSQTSAQLAPWQAGRVLSFIEDNLAAPLLIRDVARVARLSSSYFSSAFKSTFGRSVKGFIIARRLARAQGLMLASDDTLAQIALTVGFADQAHFSRCFRNNIGSRRTVGVSSSASTATPPTSSSPEDRGQ